MTPEQQFDITGKVIDNLLKKKQADDTQLAKNVEIEQVAKNTMEAISKNWPDLKPSWQQVLNEVRRTMYPLPRPTRGEKQITEMD